MTLTSKNLHSIATAGSGFNGAQLSILGVTDMSRGWLQKLIGREIPDETFDLLMSLKGLKPKDQKKLVPEISDYPSHGKPDLEEQFRKRLHSLLDRYSDRLPRTYMAHAMEQWIGGQQ